MAAQEESIAKAPLPLPRDEQTAKSTADVLRAVREGGKEGMAELLTELQRQMVEAERCAASPGGVGTEAAAGARAPPLLAARHLLLPLSRALLSRALPPSSHPCPRVCARSGCGASAGGARRRSGWGFI